MFIGLGGRYPVPGRRGGPGPDPGGESPGGLQKLLQQPGCSRLHDPILSLR
jgi:hypothetical protein